jgi:4-aminobutyrate aminotransferase
MIEYVLSRDSDVAALVAEPMRAVPYVAAPGFWRRVREICDRHGTLLIFDEIPTGLGKTGRMFACEHDGVVPDILVLGKGLGGGILPIAAVVAKPESGRRRRMGFRPLHAREKSGHRARRTDHDPDHRGRRSRGERSPRRGRSTRAARRHDAPRARDRRCAWAWRVLGIEIVRSRDTREANPDLAEAVLYRALDAGLSFKTTMGNVLTLTPPLVVSEAQMLQALAIIEEAITAA